MAGIEKGKVLSVAGDKAKVQSVFSTKTVSPLISIPKRLRDGEIVKGTQVAYTVFPDGTGIIIGRMDGEE